MKSKINTIVACDILFLLLLIVSGSIKNAIISDVFYYLAFLAPITLGFILIKRDRLAVKDAEELFPIELSIKKAGLLSMLPFIFPAILAIIIISYLTSVMMGIFGFENAREFEEPFAIAIILHAAAPALLEELLFRYIPLNLLSERPKHAAILSSILFAFAHANLFQIPYALAAGLIFATVDIGCASLIPSFLIHLINNVISLSLIYGANTAVIISAVAVLSAISIIFIALHRKKYAKFLAPYKDKSKTEILGAPILFMGISLFIAMTNLIFS